jgi:glycerophosphoryl diester phosphodiesterase
MPKVPAMIKAISALALVAAASAPAFADGVELGPRPLFLVDAMQPSPLKDQLMACAANPSARSQFSIGHRGAPLQFPEHTVESNRAAARMGAGVLECDVTFTSDRALVCRHAQNDLHTSTNILATPLAATCVQPFTPAAGETPAAAECRTSEITLAEFQTLKGKMDGADTTATTVEAYMDGTAPFRSDLYSPGTLMTRRIHYAVPRSWREVHAGAEGACGRHALQRLHARDVCASHD